MKVTLFFGAGFSAPYGHPVMNNFLSYLDTCKRITEQDRNLVSALVLEARHANSFLESSPTNLEDILSFSVMSERLALVKEGENRHQRLCEIIQKVYTSSPDVGKFWKRYSTFRSFIGFDLDEPKHDLSFITTNYDLNIECACLFNHRRTNPGFYIKQIDSHPNLKGDSIYLADGIPLYKLHGSINWFLSEKMDIEIENRVVNVRTFENTDWPILPLPCASDYKSPTIPIIIPPSFLKPDLPEALKQVWRYSAKALSETNILVFIGYSFPSSDTEMMYFLASTLKENTNLRAVYIVDPKADDILRRLKTENKIGTHFKELIIPVNSDWTQTKLPIAVK
jgi:hypothetical protein